MQQITISAGGYAAADPNAIATSQLQDAGSPFVFDGVNGNTYTSAIADAQTLSGAGNFTLNGTQITIDPPQSVFFTTTADETSVNFTVIGFDINYAAQVEVVAGVDTSVVATVKKFAIVTQVSADAATASDVSVGYFAPAIVSPAGRITITPAGDESANSFTITGTDWSGNKISEVLAGKNATASVSVLDYATVNSVIPTNATAAAVEIGTAQSGGSRWVRLDEWAYAPTGLAVTTSGTVNYTVEQTFDDPNSPTFPVAVADVDWENHPDTNFVAKTGNAQGGWVYDPTYARIVINSGDGSVRMTIRQYGNAPY